MVVAVRREPRLGFGSRAGFVLSGVGAAVGLGNIWRFPQRASENGGAAFVFVYILLLVLIGLPLLWAELAIGQRAQTSTVAAMKDVAGRRWRSVGYIFIGATFIFFGYYSVLAGLALNYVVNSFSGTLANDPASYLDNNSAGPMALLFGVLFTVITFTIVSRGVSKGIEKANLFLMPALFALVAGLAIYAVLQPGAGAGIEFYMGFDASEVTAETFAVAAGQVFFSIGIGFGILLTYASYTKARRAMLGNASMIAGADLLVAIVAGFMIFPLVFAEGLQDQVIASGGQDVGTGAALFLTMPSAFLSIGGFLGSFLMLLFFLMICFAALSSTIAALEVLVSWLSDTYGWKRWKCALIGCMYPFILGIFAAFYADIFTWLDDFLSLVVLFVGAVGLCLLYAFRVYDKGAFLLGGQEDANPFVQGTARIFGFLIAYVIPFVLLVIFIINFPTMIDALFNF